MTSNALYRSVAAALGVATIILSLATSAQADATQVFSKYAKDSSQTVNHSAWDSLLKKYVVATPDGLNRVRYQAFKAADHETLKQYITSLEALRPTTFNRTEQFAYWANLYNAKTIDVVLEAYPVKSIKEITLSDGLLGFLKKSVGAGGPWKAKVIRVEGVQLSLDDIEHNILRPVFKDPRVHYAVNCASVGCPNLPRAAFTSATLEEMLNAGARTYINSPRGFEVKAGSIKASSIYSWFQADFGGSAAGVLKHATQYAEPALQKKLRGVGAIDDYGYDWSLNDVQ